MIEKFIPFWPVAKQVLQMFGLLTPEDKEKEREYQLKFLEAQENQKAALFAAWEKFQGLWSPPADRVYIWANTVIKLYIPTIIGLAYYDVFVGSGKAIARANELTQAGFGGLAIIAVLLYPMYAPFLGEGVGALFSAAVAGMKKVNGGLGGGSVAPAPTPGKPGVRPVTPTKPPVPTGPDRPDRPDRSVPER